jgi:hypothetical protein
MDERRVWSIEGIYTDGENTKYSEANLSVMLLSPPQIPMDVEAS